MRNQTSSTLTGRRGGKVALGIACAVAGGLLVGGPASALGSHANLSQPAGSSNSMWAVINGDNGGVGISDGHVATSQKLADTLDGQGYRVTFDRRVRECSPTATIATAFLGDIANAGKGISVTADTSNPNAFIVKTKDLDGGFIFNAASFSLQVECA
jgi:hypothetical protein